MNAKVRADDVLAELGARVRTLRDEAGWTREMLAAFGGCSHTTLRNLESGAHWPTTDTLIRLALALGVRLDDLIPERAYVELMSPAMSFLERRFAQSLPPEAARTGDKAASSHHSSQSSKAAGKRQPDTTRTALTAVAKKPADKATKLPKVKDSHITIRRHVA